MRRTLNLYWVAFALAGCGGGATDESAPTAAATSSGLRFLQGDASGEFARAMTPRAFAFPADHGGHPEYRTEWWYLTGNVDGPEGREFGFQVTFFRFALGSDGQGPSVGSSWRAQNAWMAHLAISDSQTGRFTARERMARGALGLAGVEDSPVRVSVEDWSLTMNQADDVLTIETAAADGEIGLSLVGSTRSRPIAQGEDGLDRKGPGPGNASYYYSVPGLEVAGEIRIEGTAVPVRGIGWLDREWGTSALSPGTVGWDWFALQFEGGGSLMYYRLRDASGAATQFSGGTLLGADGSHRRLAAGDVTVEPREFWVSERSRARYPVAWRLVVPSAGLDLNVAALLPDQEIDLSVRYWEGAVRFESRAADQWRDGRGYVELTGY